MLRAKTPQFPRQTANSPFSGEQMQTVPVPWGLWSAAATAGCRLFALACRIAAINVHAARETAVAVDDAAFAVMFPAPAASEAPAAPDPVAHLMRAAQSPDRSDWAYTRLIEIAGQHANLEYRRQAQEALRRTFSVVGQD